MSMIGHSLRRYTSSIRRQNRRILFVQPAAGLRVPHRHCYLSTVSSSSPPPIITEKQKRIPRTLYRQLLRWCIATDARIPLEAFIDPVDLAPPQIDEEALEGLEEISEMEPEQIRKAYDCLPSGVQISKDSLKASIRNTNDLKGLIRAVFRLNAPPAGNEELNKKRVTFAFQTLRTFNELGEALDDLIQHRESHKQREEVLYHVGQVIQHKHERWRGVIMGWEKPTKLSADQEPKPLSSMTTKTYTSGDFLNSVRYEVLLDTGDVHTMQATASMIISTQEDLESVLDPSLCRVRSNMITHHFTGFNAQTNAFMMNDMLAYEYPVDYEMHQSRLEKDKDDKDEVSQTQPAIEELGFEVGDLQLPKISDEEAETIAKETEATIKYLLHKLGLYLATNIISANAENSQDDHERDQNLGEKLSLLQAYEQKLSNKAPLPVQHHQGHIVYATEDTCPIASASAHLRQLLNFILELRETLWHRKKLQEAHNIQFELGQVVYHNFFGFRGVVVGIDPTPAADVSRWDGVQHLDNPNEQPFYFVLPDEEDCLKAFGGTRGMRYVCQENMEACEGDQCAVSIPMEALEPGWSQQLSSNGFMTYVAPSHVKFKHGSDIGDNNLTEECLTKVESAISSWEVDVRDAAKAKKEGVLVDLMEMLVASSTSKEKEPPSQISITGLLQLLRATRNLDDAVTIEEFMKDVFRAHPDRALHRQLEGGISEIIRGDNKSALKTFESLVEKDDEYAEAWNKVGASQYMLGEQTSALEASKKAVERQPLNFQAFSGAGLCEYEQGKYENAAALFRQCLSLNPWSPIATKLAACIDMLKQRQSDEKEDAPTEK